MSWISIPELSKKCKLFIEKNPQLEILKSVCKNGEFIFYREYVNIEKIKNVIADIRIRFVKNEKGVEGWCVAYMRYTGKWETLPIFGDFDNCLNEIKSGKWEILKPIIR